MGVLDRALAESRKRAGWMTENARRAAGTPSGAILSSAPPGRGMVGPGLGAISQSPLSGRAAEQQKHFTGWVYSCIRPIAQRIAGQCVRVARLTGKPASGRSRRASLPNNFKALELDQGAVELIEDHALVRALNDPNDIMVRWALLYVTVCSLEMTGKAFWWCKKKADKNNRPRRRGMAQPSEWEIWPIPSSWMTPIHTDERLFARWRIQPDQSAPPTDVDGDEIVYFYYPDFTDPLGCVSPLQTQAAAVAADEAIVAAQLQGFKNGIKPGLLLTVGRNPDIPGQPMGSAPRREMTMHQRAQIIHYIKSYYKGVMNWDEPLILDNLIEKATKLSNSVMEMDFPQSGRVTKERISQGFGTNPIIMGQIENANRASAVVADENFCSNTINPKLELLSEVMTAWLGPMFAGPSERLLIYIEPATVLDPEFRLKKVIALADRGGMSINELRHELLGLQPIAGGDVVLVNQQLVPYRVIPADEAPDDYSPFLDANPAGQENGQQNGNQQGDQQGQQQDDQQSADVTG